MATAKEAGEAGVPALMLRMVRASLNFPQNENGWRAETKVLDWMMRIVKGFPASSPAEASHMCDVISKKLCTANDVSKAAEFSKLYRRLSSIPLLRNRAAILLLLHSVSSLEQTPPAVSSAFASLGLPSVEPALAPSGTTTGMKTLARDKQRERVYETFTKTADSSYEVAEADLLRDTIFALQGIDGTYIKFSGDQDGYVIDPSVFASRGSRVIVRRLCELGWLFKLVTRHMQERESQASQGLVGQAFCAAVHSEMGDYYRLLAVLEAQILAQARSAEEGARGGAEAREERAEALTLRRLLVWTQDPMQRMKMIAVLTEACRGLHGGEIISRLAEYTKHGDPFVQEFVAHVLRQTCRPMMDMIARWVFEGDLRDPWQEFFVAQKPEVTNELLWQEKYTFRANMCPALIPDNTAQKVLLIGKSINFMRQCCSAGTWVMDGSAEAVAEMDLTDVEKLQTVIDKAAEKTNAMLRDAMFKRYKVRDHLTALKRYLLLAQGDFIDYLVFLLSQELEKSHSEIFRHNLLGMRDGAMRETNAQFEPADIAERIDVRLLKSSRGDTGWDVFCLDYRVEPPLTTLFHPAMMRQYQRVFVFLWRLKRAEAALSATFQKHVTSTHALRGITEIQTVLKKGHVLRNEMMHFIYNFQYYVMFEVEAAWGELVKDLDSVSGLDDIVAAHEKYMTKVADKALLGGQGEAVVGQLDKMVVVMVAFNKAQDAFYDIALTEVARRRQQEIDAEKRTKEGKWGISDKGVDVDYLEQSLAPQAQREVMQFNDKFEELIMTFLDLVADPSASASSSLRDLSFRLDFNEYYARVRARKSRAAVGV